MNEIQPRETRMPRVDAVRQWRAPLAAVASALLLYESLSGVLIYALPFSIFNQFNLLLHTIVGVAALVPVGWYMVGHWRLRRGGSLSHYQLLGYAALALLVACIVSGAVVTWQGAAQSRISSVWDMVHLVSGFAVILFIAAHLATSVLRKVNRAEGRRHLRMAQRAFGLRCAAGCGLLLLASGLFTTFYQPAQLSRSFDEDYNWRFGDDRPFAPSLAKLDQSHWQERIEQQLIATQTVEGQQALIAALQNEDPKKGVVSRMSDCASALQMTESQQKKIEEILAQAAHDVRNEGALDSQALAGSSGCGTSGCHEQIYQEWLPSAHRYSAMDDMFQQVQELMADETSPEHTRYCAGCHDPISLFSGAKNSGNITLSAHGADEGSSCLVCHSISQTDVHGNANYVITPPERYVFETHDGTLAKFVSDFLIRTYPRHHVESYSRPLYKTAEFCAACHKQYIDKEVNTDIGNVQGQNQYDSWKNSRWYHEDNPEMTISCRECHMPLADSTDPARGDVLDDYRTAGDRKHRTHGMVASNQYVPRLMNLENAEHHTQQVEKWLRGEIEIPEIADRWVDGPVVKMEVRTPETVSPGDEVALDVVLINNKTGHDFPTGPLDMIESWVELTVADSSGQIVYHSGGLDEEGQVLESAVLFKSDGFDRKGELIDRHNLWDMVGASYKRALYPGMTDALQVRFQCPSMARKRVRGADQTTQGERTESYSFAVAPSDQIESLQVTAVLWYRKANPEFLNRVYGKESGDAHPGHGDDPRDDDDRGGV